jgi:hypothetical protein
MHCRTAWAQANPQLQCRFHCTHKSSSSRRISASVHCSTCALQYVCTAVRVHCRKRCCPQTCAIRSGSVSAPGSISSGAFMLICSARVPKTRARSYLRVARQGGVEWRGGACGVSQGERCARVGMGYCRGVDVHVVCRT